MPAPVPRCGERAIARDTGAEVIAGTADAALLARGGLDDPQYGDRFPFAPVQVTRTVADGERLRLGDLVMTAHAAPGFQLIGNPDYPDVVADFRASFAKVAALPCDIALAPHPGMVDFWARVERRDQGDAGALIDGTLCRAYAEHARRALEGELAGPVS